MNNERKKTIYAIRETINVVWITNGNLMQLGEKRRHELMLSNNKVLPGAAEVIKVAFSLRKRYGM